MELFEVVGLLYPGRVHVYKRGEINLHDIDDKTAEELFKNGCIHLRPTAKGMEHLYGNIAKKPEVIVLKSSSDKVKKVKTTKGK